MAEDIRFGGGNFHVNSPLAILHAQLMLTVFYMFVATAFVANAVVRDDESRFAPIVRATRVSKFDYLFGRFSGALFVALIAFAVVPLAIGLGSVMPWLDPETVGPNRIADYLISFALFTTPSIVFMCALFFAVATATRSMTACYVAVVGFLMLYVGFDIVMGGEHRDVAAMLDPFGLSAVSNETRYWTAAEANSQLPALNGVLVANRVLMLVLSGLALWFAYARFSFSVGAGRCETLRRLTAVFATDSRVPSVVAGELPAARPDMAGGVRLLKITWFEINQVVRSPALTMLLLVGLLNSLIVLVFGHAEFGTPSIPATFSIIPSFAGTFMLVPITVAIYYGGVVVWRDRDCNIHEVVDSTWIPGWAYMVPKTIAVVLVLFATLLVSMAAAMTVQAFRGYFNFEIEKYLFWYVLPFTVDLLLIAVLSVFVQALSPSKVVGWCVMVVYVVAVTTFPRLGLEHPLILYAAQAPLLLSDMNGNAVTGSLGWWLRLYWGGAALMLALIAHLLWRRGVDVRFAPRMRQAFKRFHYGAALTGMLGLFVFVGTGLFLFSQMNISNTYRDQDAFDALTADYEKAYLKYTGLKQPSLTDVVMAIDIFPQERRLEAVGSLTMVNDTGAPVDELHVRLPNFATELIEVQIPGATLVQQDLANQHYIFRFATPLGLGERKLLRFKSRRWHRALSAEGYDTRLVENGTFLRINAIAPQLGMNTRGLLTDPVTRRKYGLAPELRLSDIEDKGARERNYAGNVDWVNSDITISTSADQTPVAPGRRVADTVADGRRVARFQSTAPILARFSIQSARYALAEREVDGVTLQVFHDVKHSYNVERMLDAMQQSLRYFRSSFGPYQFDHARIVEFPGYDRYAQAFAGTIAYAESIGFLANPADIDKIDYVTYVTAHEMAHQYWGNQLMAADMQGATLLIETLAQYSALMVMKTLYGDDHMRRFLKYELDAYLRARGSERVEEVALERVENQGYLHYNKGSVVTYLLQDRLGEARVNAMLAELLERHRFKSQPYASATELVDGFTQLARNASERALVRDLLQRITIYDFRTEQAVVREIGADTFETTITIRAAKHYAAGNGAMTEAALEDAVEVGLFIQQPDTRAVAADDILLIKRYPLVSGAQQIKVVTSRRPNWVGVDPYHKYIDRNTDDNTLALDSP
ncbi:MAG: M1 family aminopeptidase [Pseudomonadota bacterium]